MNFAQLLQNPMFLQMLFGMGAGGSSQWSNAIYPSLFSMLAGSAPGSFAPQGAAPASPAAPVPGVTGMPTSFAPAPGPSALPASSASYGGSSVLPTTPAPNMLTGGASPLGWLGGASAPAPVGASFALPAGAR